METVQKKTLPADLSTPDFIDRYRTKALFIGFLFGIFSLVILLRNHEYFLRGYLVGFMLCFGFSLGCLALLMVQYLSGGKWGLLIRRILEASTANLVLVAGFFAIFVWLGGVEMYPWAHPEKLEEAARQAVKFRQHLPDFLSFIPYQTKSGFIGRAIIYFAIWLGYALVLRKWSMDRDKDQGNHAYWRVKFENLCGFGVLVYVLTMTAAVVDWVLSLDPQWYSTMYGLIFLAGQGLASLALIIITLAVLSQADPVKTLLRKTELHDIGKLTFAFVMLFAYFSFSQFLIVWSGNLSDEVPWYLNRIRGGWGYFAMMVVIGHFALPFLLLLSRNLKRNKAKIVPLAAFILGMRLVDMIWQVGPNFEDSKGHLPLRWAMLSYLIVPVAMVAVWVAAFLWQLKRRPLIQANDPHLEEILEPEHLLEVEHAAV